ncbi:hypothetical protein F511_46158 [Dorcoceras hygrometricum]|uniref:Uncharacterized protein n=1 Tax=Dorcoceras hygrometricum TaxID=472368 RepID=A0A2Z6ZU87_9LAMI|nr:hypothetical protein F511_46158 [Dorcoceras hygrometricum]
MVEVTVVPAEFLSVALIFGESWQQQVTVARAGEFCNSSDVVSVTYEDLLVLVRVEVAAGWLLLISRRACARALKWRRLD